MNGVSFGDSPDVAIDDNNNNNNNSNTNACALDVGNGLGDDGNTHGSNTFKKCINVGFISNWR